MTLTDTDIPAEQVETAPIVPDHGHESIEPDTILSALTISHISKSINDHVILSDVSISVAPGEVFGFLGPNGAGKTTTMKCILDLVTPEEGEIRIFGQAMGQDIRRIIGFMPENTYIYRHLTGREFLMFCGRFFDIPAAELTDRVTQLLERVGLIHAADRRLATYSKGMLQRANIAQAIIHEPRIVFLDEPMSGLDPLGRRLVKDILRDLRDRGTTIFFNTHILSDVENICDRFAIIHHGRIIAEGTISDLTVPLEDFFITQIQGASGEEITIE